MKKTLALLLGLGFLLCWAGEVYSQSLKEAEAVFHRKEFAQNAVAYKKLFTQSKKIGYGHGNLSADEWYKNSADRMLLRFSKVGDTGSIAGWPVTVKRIIDENTCLLQWSDLHLRAFSWFYLLDYPTEELIPFDNGKGRIFIIGDIKVVGKKAMYHWGADDTGGTVMYPAIRLLKLEETTESPTKAAANLTPEELAAAVAAAKLEASFHIWTYKKGKKTFDARFLSYDSKTETLTLEDRDGNEIQVKPTELVKEDTVFYKSEIERLEKERIEALTRVWTVKGVEITAIFVSEKNGKVTLRSPQTNKAKTFAMTTLSQDDLRWITEHEAE